MATVVEYNGVTLYNVTTRQWDEEVVYDASHTDILYRKIRMRFQGLLHRGAAYTPGAGGEGWGPVYITGPGVTTSSSTPEIFALVQPRLLMSRQQLRVSMNGQVVLETKSFGDNNGYNDTIDLDNGPKPIGAQLVHVAGDQTFRIDFSIECCIDANNSPVDGQAIGNGTGVINNRWSITETYASNFAATRTIRGRLRLTHWLYNAHNFRQMVVPPLEQSFCRERMDFQVAEDGLTCDYQIVDKQVHVAAPWPACKVEGTYTESTNDGTQCIADMGVTVEGPLSASVQLLIVRAMQMIDTRLDIIQPSDNYSILAASITEVIGERNIVQAHVKIAHTKKLEQTGAAKIYSRTFGQGNGGTERLLDLSKYGSLPGQPAPYHVWNSQYPELFGYMPGTQQPRQAAFLFALGCFYQDPWHPRGVGVGAAATANMGGYPNDAPITTVSGYSGGYSPTEATTSLSDENAKATYTYTRMATRYITNACNVQLPIASASTSTSQNTAADGTTPGSGDTSATVSLAPPQVRREIHYDSERVGQWPEIPGVTATYEDGNGLKGTLLRSWDKILPPTVAADKTQPVLRIQGYRLYAMNRLPNAGEKVRVGILPHTSFTQADTAIDLTAQMTDRMMP